MDRAALDAARALGLPSGGWCPRGRRAEDGRIPSRYPLAETPSWRYPERTEWNVRDSDGTLILTRGAPRGGTALTISLARRWKRPCLVLDLAAQPEVGRACEWLEEHDIHTLNVAGPRESETPGVQAQALRFLMRLLGARAEPGRPPGGPPA